MYQRGLIILTHLTRMEFWKKKKHSQGMLINPFKSNGISHSYQMDQSTSVLRDVG